MEVDQGPNWGCSAKDKNDPKHFPEATHNILQLVLMQANPKDFLKSYLMSSLTL
jgi:hypothetical protein